MISRHWRGIARESSALEYLEHLRRDTFPQLNTIPGFIDGSVVSRTVPQGVEFLVVTHWESTDAIRAFAGEDAEAAVVPDMVQALMISFETRATHYEQLLHTTGLRR